MSSRELWNRYASYFNAEEGTVFPHDQFEMDFYRELRKRYPGRCLEIGAGSGRLSRSLLQAGDTFALEPSDEMLRQWSPGARELALRVQGTGENLPFPSDSFNFTCFPYNGLQCVLQPSDRRIILEEAYRVTSPGGVFVLEVSPVFGRREGEPLTERYRAALPDGRELLLKESVEKCDSSASIKYHMFYTVTDSVAGSSFTDRMVLELAAVTEDEIKTSLLEVGFTRLKIWGDYDQSGYDRDLSPRLLVQAEKGELL